MKKLLMTLCVAMIGVGAYAQKNYKAVGADLTYGSAFSNLGIGVKGQYGLTDKIRLEGSFDYFLEKDGVSMWNVNANAHYLFPVAEKVKVYPLAGLTYVNAGLGSEGSFGVNLGAGVQYDINNQWAANFETKYQLISNLHLAVFSVGVAYKF